MKHRSYLVLFVLTLGGLFVHGYHPAAEDGEIYLPGIKKILNPSLYPFGSEFFQNHAGLTQFGNLIAASVRISHLSFDLTVFIWYLASLFLTLLACWEWSGEFFEEREARWAGVVMVAGLLTLPVAGTSLYISDQYLTPRSIVLFAVLFATLNAWRGRYVWFAVWSVFAALVHPLMAGFGISFGLLLIAMKQQRRTNAWGFVLLPNLGLLTASSAAYRQVVQTRSYFFILRWEWYEWIGIFAPLLLFWWFSRMARAKPGSALHLVSLALIVYGAFYFLLALILTIPERFIPLARLQPMRSLHLLYTFLIVIGGGLLGAYVLKRHAWRWVVLFVPLCAGMWFAQRQLFPASAHIEWPDATPSNDWLRAFEWVKENTPVNAVFAIDPNYMRDDDQHGFRAIAERSRLADAVKDSGAVTMFPQPPFAENWLEEVSDEKDWAHFQLVDMRRLEQKYGVTWVILEKPGIAGLVCPYSNSKLLVCHIS